MNLEEQLLWNAILDFNIDDPTASYTFTDRLCKENGWSMEYALRAILEYKKFMLLICVSDVPQAPSDQVDQVWHLHLLYTQSYWISFCKNVLKKDIHHNPTTGSEPQGTFKELYDATLQLYALKFGEEPPKDIWPSPQDKSTKTNYIRINKHAMWVIPKLKWLQ